MTSPLTAELSPEAKEELAAVFAALRKEYPPVRIQRLGDHIYSVPMFRQKPWQQNRRGW